MLSFGPHHPRIRAAERDGAMNPQAPGGGVPEPPPSSGGDASDTGTELRRTRIMVIDDDWLVATALSRILTKSYDVVTEHSGTAALETLRRDPAFDVIVCDVMMPEMDGPTLYEALASYEPHLRSRFLFISGGDV
jgi:response regulator RpfG family c-di-GMP phosphodiesterase